jgi:integrase
MPAEPRGWLYRTATGHGIRWRDEHGVLRRQSGFTSRSEARSWFDNVERKRMRGETPPPSPLTLAELVDEYLEQHVAEANTIRVLTDRLKLAIDGIPVKPRAKEREHGLGEIRVDRLDVRTVGAWRRRLPEGSAWHAHKALRQVLAYAVRAKLASENVAKLIPNPEPKRREAASFGSWDELEKLAAELPPERRSLPILVAGTGLRPEEWLALERRDVDTKAGVLHVRRVWTDGRLKEYGKQDRSLRRVPLRRRALDALEAHPWRIDTPLVYVGERGEHLNLHAWRRDEWYPALDAAGLRKLVPYAMRHTFASFAIAAGVSLFYLARLMGSSVEQIDRTYGHLLPDSEDYLRGLLDSFDAVSSEEDSLSTDSTKALNIRRQ